MHWCVDLELIKSTCSSKQLNSEISESSILFICQSGTKVQSHHLTADKLYCVSLTFTGSWVGYWPVGSLPPRSCGSRTAWYPPCWLCAASRRGPAVAECPAWASWCTSYVAVQSQSVALAWWRSGAGAVGRTCEPEGGAIHRAQCNVRNYAWS